MERHSSWYFGRYWTLTATVMAGGTATGLGYCFSTYSPALKSSLSLSQSGLNAISNAPNYMSLPPLVLLPGLLSDRTGPRLTLLFAAACLFVGYGTMYLAITGKATAMGLHETWVPSVTAVAWCIANFGSGSTTVATMSTTIKNFPHRRGIATGFLKSLTGLAGGMVTQVYLGFLAPHTFQLLLMLALGSASVVVISSAFINVIPWAVDLDPETPRRRADLARLSFGLVGMAALAATVMASAFVIRAENAEDSNDDGESGSAAAAWGGSGSGNQAGGRGRGGGGGVVEGPGAADRVAALAVIAVFACQLLLPIGTNFIVRPPATTAATVAAGGPDQATKATFSGSRCAHSTCS